MSNKLKFQPKARIIRTIGDQLISGPEAAVIELVKNSYDADATFVRVKFFPPLLAGQGRIEITDDGHGMLIDDIRSKWMEPATASKVKIRKSTNRNRTMMGSKGIGRFATAKLGASMSLLSTAKTKNKYETILIPEIEWSIFSDDVYLADIEIDYVKQTSGDKSGTSIEVRNLNEIWNKEKLSRLYTELRRLVSPLGSQNTTDDEFKIYLDLSECTEKNCGFDGRSIVPVNPSAKAAELYLVKPIPLLTACDYELTGKFDQNGKFSGNFQVKRAGRGLEQVSLNIPADKDSLSPGEFEVKLFIFDREADSIKRNMRNAGLGELTAGEARKILDRSTGVSIYRESFRIRPYGDPQNDWLALDTRRVQNPSLRIGHNQIFGLISVASSENSNLFERSSREGFEENTAFLRLTELVLKLLSQVVEPKRNKFREDAGISRKKDASFEEIKKLSELNKLRKFITSLTPKEQETAGKILDQQSAKILNRIEALEDRQRVLEAKSSLGAILGEVLHEGSPAARYLADTSKRLFRRLPGLLNTSSPDHEKNKQDFIDKLHYIRDYGVKLNSLFINLEPLAGGKRGKPKYFFPISAVSSAIELFKHHSIKFTIENNAKGAETIGYTEDLSTALINLIANAVHWLEDNKSPSPTIVVSLYRNKEDVKILVKDNGPGIPHEFQEKIFDVGFSLKEGGTGLGLNIAREALSRSGAKLFLHTDVTNGTLFEISFPAKRLVK